MSRSPFHRLFAYEAWANTESVDSATRMSDPPAAAVRWLARHSAPAPAMSGAPG